MAESAEAGRLIPLHLGDTAWLPPDVALAVPVRNTHVHRYGPVTGLLPLREAIAQRLTKQFEQPTDTADVFITPGATGALSVTCAGLLEPGEECLVVTPSWPLIFGILQGRGVKPVEVDIGPAGWPEDDAGEGFLRRLETAITPATTAIYLSDPNNPAGFIYPRSHLEAVADLARRHDLWVVVDAVYHEVLVGDTRPHPLATWEDMAARTITVGSFSKSLSMAGHRVGFVTVPSSLRALMPRLITHFSYHASVAGQHMAERGLTALDDHLDTALERLRTGASLVANNLKAPFQNPDAGTFVFLDLRQRCQNSDATLEFLSQCLDRDVALAPGAAFGTRFGCFVRLCFTATEPEALEDGIARINDALKT